MLGTEPRDLGPRTGNGVSAEMEAILLVTVPAGLVLFKHVMCSFIHKLSKNIIRIRIE